MAARMASPKADRRAVQRDAPWAVLKATPWAAYLAPSMAVTTVWWKAEYWAAPMVSGLVEQLERMWAA